MCGDWVIRKLMNPRYMILENNKAYAILLNKEHYSESIIELIEAMIR